MNCHCIIKILLRCPHFDGHGKPLQHLVTTYSKNVQSNNLRRNEKQSEDFSRSIVSYFGRKQHYPKIKGNLKIIDC